MTADGDVGYPTQGEVLRFLFNVAGVLPAKRDPASPDDAKRKSLQRALGRLATEEGELEEKFNELVDQFLTLVADYAELPPIALAAHDVVCDMLSVYQEVFRGEGTYLSKRDTVRWLLRHRWVPTAAGAIARSITRFGLRAFAPYFPEAEGWYLPSDATTKQRWPLQKAMAWLYGRAVLSQTQCHYPGRDAAESDDDRQRDLENAQSWRQGRSLPSAAVLRWTFGRALKTETSQRIPGFEKPLQAECAQAALFLGRLATSVGQAIADNFGEDFLAEVSEAFQHQLGMALAETEPLESEIAKLAMKYRVSPLDIGLRSDVLASWAEGIAERTHYARMEVDKDLQAGTLSPERTDELIKRFGELPVTAGLPDKSEPAVPKGFGPLLFEGLRLGKQPDLTDAQVDVYEGTLRGSNIERALAWICPWLRFRISYRREDYAQAWTWISEAYQAAKYCAGAKQYTLVNQYIELAVKAGDRVAFRNGVRWARYIGSEVRWLRDKELTQENIDFTWYIFERARYSV